MKAESTLHLRSCFLPFNFISSPLRAPLPLLHPPLDLPPAYPPHAENDAAQHQGLGCPGGSRRGLQWGRQKSWRGQTPRSDGGLYSVPRVGALCEGIAIGMMYTCMCTHACKHVVERTEVCTGCSHASWDQWGLSLYRWEPPVGGRLGKGS